MKSKKHKIQDLDEELIRLQNSVETLKSQIFSIRMAVADLTTSKKQQEDEEEEVQLNLPGNLDVEELLA